MMQVNFFVHWDLQPQVCQAACTVYHTQTQRIFSEKFESNHTETQHFGSLITLKLNMILHPSHISSTPQLVYHIDERLFSVKYNSWKEWTSRGWRATDYKLLALLLDFHVPSVPSPPQSLDVQLQAANCLWTSPFSFRCGDKLKIGALFLSHFNFLL